MPPYKIDSSNVEEQIMSDPVNPDHYRKFGDMSPLHIAERYELGYHLGQSIKYILRAGHKETENTLVDLKKAVWYLNRHIHNLDPSHPDPLETGGSNG